jgi:RNA polymerase sigma-70 factor, ECF subfamily
MPPSRLEVVSTRRSWLLGRARFLCGTRSDAEDIVQETFLRFTSTFPRDSALPESWSCTSWLLSTMSNCYYDQCRRRRVRERCLEDPLLSHDLEMVESPDAVDGPPWDRISVEELRCAIDRLTAGARIAMSMYLDGRKNSEIARELGISYGAVAKRLYDARAQLRRLLGPDLH